MLLSNESDSKFDVGTLNSLIVSLLGRSVRAWLVSPILILILILGSSSLLGSGSFLSLEFTFVSVLLG